MSKLNVNIISPPVFDFSAKKFKIGGIETYVKELASILNSAGFYVKIYQIGIANDIIIDQIEIISERIKGNNIQKLFDRIYNKKEIFILATDQLDIKCKHNNVISIQHGIAFDIPIGMLPKIYRKIRFLGYINKFLRCMRNLYRYNKVRNNVCVDYNFYNWVKTIGDIDSSSTMKVIPNFTSAYISITELESKLCQNNNLRIIFARRFVDYRGTIMFSNVAKKILKDYNDVKITFAGEGPLKDFLEQEFGDHPRVEITKFDSADSVMIHYKHDIAIVPTLFSEGTSLALCEAMAAGCYPIATHVGGMTNMIIDNYNGKLVYPSEKDLYNELSKVLELDRASFSNVVRNAYNTARTSFSKELWASRWIETINDISHN